MKAVTAAINSAPTSKMTFFLSMTEFPLKVPQIEECFFT
jgi:hypothetical protein